MAGIAFRSLSGLPEVRPGDDLAALIAAAIEREQPRRPLADGQILVIAQKAVSKAEGALVELAQVSPGERALQLAAEAEREGSQRKDPRVLQVVLDQSAEIVRAQRGVLICRTHHGLVCANAGVDASNAEQPETLIVLPTDPDASARGIRARLRALTGATPGVLITDSFGRAWRSGQCDTAIGCAGIAPLDDWRGRRDAFGRTLSATLLAVADAIAAASDLTRTKDSREPVVIADGLARLTTAEDGPGAAALIRPPQEDLFR